MEPIYPEEGSLPNALRYYSIKVAAPPKTALEWRRKGILTVLQAGAKPMTRAEWVEAAVAIGWTRRQVERDIDWLQAATLVAPPHTTDLPAVDQGGNGGP